MKIKEGKHDHNLTKLLKVCLFCLVMLLPFLAILPSTLYFAFNEHAQNYTHEEVITTYEYETNEVNSVDDLVVGNIYHLKLENYSTSNNFWIETELIYNSNFNNLGVEVTAMSFQGIRTINDRLYVIGLYQIQNLNISYGSNYVGYRSNLSVYFDIELDFVYKNLNADDSNLINYISASDYLGEKNVEVIENEQSPLNAFNTASTTIWNSPIFNWVNNGLGSIAIANMLTVFGIARNTFISNILIYWLSITAIYVVIDIVIGAFTLLTHLFNKKAE